MDEIGYRVLEDKIMCPGVKMQQALMCMYICCISGHIKNRSEKYFS